MTGWLGGFHRFNPPERGTTKRERAMASQALKRRFPVGRALIVLVGAAVVFLLATVAVAAPHGSHADRVRAIERARLQALVTGDTATAGRYIADDFELVTPTGDLTTRDDYLGVVEAGIVDYLVFEPASPIEVDLHGDSATVRFQVSFDLIAGDVRLTHQGWITEIYELRNGSWQIVWEQATAVPNDYDLFFQSLLPAD
jgi:hypothetical protein